MIILFSIALILMYLVFIRPIFSTLKSQRDFEKYMKTSQKIRDFIGSDEYLNTDETKRIKLAEQYLTLVNRNLTTETNYKKLNKQAKEIFKDIIPEFKQEDRNEKLDNLLK